MSSPRSFGSISEDILDRQEQKRDEVSDQVAEFLAKGGKITTMEECSPAEASYRAIPPHKYRCKKTGKMKIYRNRYKQSQPGIVMWSSNTK
jgi:hypothetical protein